MDNAQITQTVRTIVSEMFRTPIESIKESTNLAELKNFDSFERVNLYLSVEKKFAIKLTTQDMLTINSVGDIIRAVQKT